MHVLNVLKHSNVKSYLFSYSALDKYYKQQEPVVCRVVTTAGIIDLAKLFSDIEFPGVDNFDALLKHDGIYYLFKTDADIDECKNHIRLLDFYYSIKENKYIDKASVYKNIKNKEFSDEIIITDINTLKDTSVLLSRYDINFKYRIDPDIVFSGESVFEQRIFLYDFLGGKYPEKALELLLDSGYIKEIWPELYELKKAEHSKEFHPEGENAWEHTLETFKYRKNNNLLISLGLLLHDLGKPEADEQSGKKFYKHAQLGSYSAKRFLERLEFSAEEIEGVFYLVKNHMLAGAVTNLPAYKTDEIMSSDMFPLLLELYRCDLLSTFRGPDAYYNACKKYKTYLKNKKNPFRNAEGKKLLKLYVE